MSTVVVERSFGRSVEVASLQALEDAVAGCLHAHRVRFLYSYTALDRRHRVCFYEAPDAEAVRITQQTGGLPFDAIWAADPLPVSAPSPPADSLVREGYSRVVVQRELPVRVDVEVVARMAEAGHECLERRKGRLVESLLARDGMRMVCAYVAPDAESVREANVELGLPVTRAWAAKRVSPP